MFTRSTRSVFGSTRRTWVRRRLPARDVIRELLKEAAGAVSGHKFGLHFLLTEWEQVVDAWQLESWEAYRDVAAARTKDAASGGAAQDLVVHLRARSCRAEGSQADHRCRSCSAHWQPRFSKSKNVVFDFAVVDEAQDISVAHLRFFAALGQRTDRTPYSSRATWASASSSSPSPGRALGVDIRGRSRTLARQLPHVPPNPHAGGPPARPCRDRRRWEQRRPERYGLRVQRPAADDLLAQK